MITNKYMMLEVRLFSQGTCVRRDQRHVAHITEGVARGLQPPVSRDLTLSTR